MDPIRELEHKIQLLEKDKAYLLNLVKHYGLSYTLPSTLEDMSKTVATHSAVHTAKMTDEHVRLFARLFQGRQDVYARLAFLKTGTAYFSVCENFWKYGLCPKTEGKRVKCSECAHKKWKPLSLLALRAHLEGKSEKCTDVVGVYPIKEDGTCCFLVFDFDNQDATQDTVNWKDEVNALRTICKQNQVELLVERSRSGKGAHGWLFFEESVPASLARQFGTLLLTQGAETVNQKSFTSYDRMLPAQDTVPVGGLGNLIALPLQGKALRAGNSAFVDENWQPYQNQWKKLQTVSKLSKTFIEEKIKQWGVNGPLGVLAENTSYTAENSHKLWETHPVIWNKEHAQGVVKITQANMLFINASNLKPPLQNQIRRLAAFSNPEFYKKQAMGFSTLGIARIIFCGYDEGNYICIPRGCQEQLVRKFQEARIGYQVQDCRQNGKQIQVTFQATLYPEQQQAAEAMLSHENGILEAATAFGKTAVGAYLIAKRRVNTLILVHNKEILKNWQEQEQIFYK